MAAPERDPLQELLRYLLVGGGMAFTVLMLTRGKWFMAAIAGLWLLAIFVRFKRAAK